METVIDFVFLNSKIIADGDCSHEIKRCLLLERKAMTNLDSIYKKKKQKTKNTNNNKKQRYYFANKLHLYKAMVFPVVMYGCHKES